MMRPRALSGLCAEQPWLRTGSKRNAITMLLENARNGNVKFIFCRLIRRSRNSIYIDRGNTAETNQMQKRFIRYREVTFCSDRFSKAFGNTRNRENGPSYRDSESTAIRFKRKGRNSENVRSRLCADHVQKSNVRRTTPMNK